MGLMEVALMEARGLHNTKLFGKMDPYVVIRYKGQEQESSVARGGSPVWNQKFRFRAEYPGSGGDYKIILRIMDKDTFSADDFVGQATIYVKDLLSFGVENGKAEMHPCSFRVVDPHESYCGEIKVGVTFTSNFEVGEESGGEDYGGWKESHH